MNNYLPRGQWVERSGSTFIDLLKGFDDTTDNYRAWLSTVIDELDPRTSTDLLTEWARIVDIELTGTIADQRDAIVEALTVDQIKTPQFFIDIATAAGGSMTLWDYYDMQSGLESRCIETGLEDGCAIHAFDGVNYASFTTRFVIDVGDHSDLELSETGLEAGSLEAGSALSVFGVPDIEFEVMRFFPRELNAVFFYDDSINKGSFI